MTTLLTNISKEYSADAVEVVRKLLIPKQLDGRVVEQYIRKAVRVGIWGKLTPTSRALLRAVALWRGVVKSRVLREIVEELLLNIELHTLRGRAMLYGVLVATGAGLHSLLNSVSSLLCLGISYLSNPPVFKLLG
ncbi:MAG: hypothetical protein RMI56_04565 [Sulfolobales archaeon]|nr:hypothetical protein [Sulfolobales archaeon]MDW8083057.1 hypothetical protein [Sulfolobales archaeon]